MAAANTYRNRHHIAYLAITDELIRRTDRAHRRNNYQAGFGTPFLAKVRSTAKITQKAMAKTLGVSERQVRNVETGRRLLSDKAVDRLITFAGKKGFRRWTHKEGPYWDYDLPWNIPSDALYPTDTGPPEPGGTSLQGCSGASETDPRKAA